jgi:hypothetical protein
MHFQTILFSLAANSLSLVSSAPVSMNDATVHSMRNMEVDAWPSIGSNSYSLGLNLNAPIVADGEDADYSDAEDTIASNDEYAAENNEIPAIGMADDDCPICLGTLSEKVVS